MSQVEELYEMAATAGDDCVLWPYTKDRRGAGRVWRGVGWKSAARVALGTVVPAPSDQHYASRRCGVAGCVNPNHLEWLTPAQLAVDSLRFGTDNAAAKLSAEQVAEIRARYVPGRRPTQAELGAEYGVGQQHVSSIVNAQYRRVS